MVAKLNEHSSPEHFSCCHKDSVELNMRQGAAYQIPCHDCDFSYIGETKRSFSIPKKEHLADIRHLRFDKSAPTKHVFDNEHSMDLYQR